MKLRWEMSLSLVNVVVVTLGCPGETPAVREAIRLKKEAFPIIPHGRLNGFSRDSHKKPRDGCQDVQQDMEHHETLKGSY